jgi:hypothetical protein
MALMYPPATTAIRDTTNMPSPFTIIGTSALGFFGSGAGVSSGASAMVLIPRAALAAAGSIQQVLCQADPEDFY